jgi:hypothetical protein
VIWARGGDLPKVTQLGLETRWFNLRASAGV